MSKSTITNEEISIIQNEMDLLFNEIRDGKHNDWCFPEFPLGWCGKVSEILKYRLEKSHGLSEVCYICKELDQRSHAWIEFKGYIIDLTAFQFDDTLPKKIFLPKEKSKFHMLFK